MNDDTRMLLKVFGVAVTDAEAKAERLAGCPAQRRHHPGRSRLEARQLRVHPALGLSHRADRQGRRPASGVPGPGAGSAAQQ